MRHIAHFTLATLLCSLLACGEDDGDGDGEISGRTQAAIEQSCKHLKDCGSKNYGSAEQCIAQVSQSYKAMYMKKDAACRDAWLAERECHITEACDQLGKGCKAEKDARWNVCKDWQN